MVGGIHRVLGAASRARQRVDLVDHRVFPPQALAALQTAQRSDLDPSQRESLVAATRQWCRLFAREPHAHLGQPSSAVADHWRHLEGQGQEHADFCAAAFGRRLPRQYPTPVGTPSPGAAEWARLHATYVRACADEDRRPPHLPLLFRVDWLLDRSDARTYAPNCGEVRYCAATEGTICLQHMASRPRRRSRWGGAAAGGIGMSAKDAASGYSGWSAP